MFMKKIKSLILKLGGPTKVADVLGKGPSTVSEMGRRGAIQSEYWRELIDHAKEQGVEGVTADHLVDLHARIKPKQLDSSHSG